VQTLSVDPDRSMKAATAELSDALNRFGANMTPASRRQTALLASELIAQVAGRDPDNGTGPVDLTVRIAPNNVRLETRGPWMPSATRARESKVAPGLAEWGQYLLDRLANRWGVDKNDPWILWAEVELV
jgi:hypothetical protein